MSNDPRYNAIKRAISVAMQLQDFGQWEVDVDGEDVFVMIQGQVNDFQNALDVATLSVLDVISSFGSDGAGCGGRGGGGVVVFGKVGCGGPIDDN